MKYMLIAGEASGDLHASRLMADIRAIDPQATFTFLGGDRMAAVAGHAPLVHITDMAFMGFSEVLRNLGAIRRNMQTAVRALDTERPDVLVPVDYPSFNLKVAAQARRRGIPVVYYISPKVWAWKEHRVRALRRLVDSMLVIFPFEVDYYRDRHRMDVTFVGNPSVAEVDEALAALPARSDFLQRHGLRDKPLIALLPGSRRGEIRNNLAVMTAAAERFPQYRAVVAGAPGIDPSFYAALTDLPVVYGDTLGLLAHSRAALVTSGTATLEAALVGTPQVACYRSNGSRLAYNLMRRLVKVPYVTLPNLIADSPVIAELLLHNCTPDAIFDALAPLLRDTPERAAMLAGYAEVRRRLTASAASAASAVATTARTRDRTRART